MYRSFVCSAFPNPANCRIVQVRPRYPVGYSPRVNGYSPGHPIRSNPSYTSPARGPYTGSTPSPESVVKSPTRFRAESYRSCQRRRPSSMASASMTPIY